VDTAPASAAACKLSAMRLRDKGRTHLIAVLLRQNRASMLGGLSCNNAVHLHCMLLQSACSLMRAVWTLPLKLPLLLTRLTLESRGSMDGASPPRCFGSSSTVPPPPAAATSVPAVLTKNSTDTCLSKQKQPRQRQTSAVIAHRENSSAIL
jgi:hypothetical protein